MKMLERYQALQTTGVYLTLIGVTMTALGGFAWNYYGRKVTEMKGVTSKELLNSQFQKAEDTSNSNTTKIINALEDVKTHRPGSNQNQRTMGESKEKHEQSKTEINANNALIVTNNQSGGNNTVVQKIPTPTVNVQNWSIQNQPVTTFLDTTIFPGREINIKEKFTVDSLFRNQLEISYFHPFTYQNIGFRVQHKDIKIGFIRYSGSILMSKTGKNGEGDFMFEVGNPGNGIYTIDFYSETAIPNMREVVNYVYPPNQ